MKNILVAALCLSAGLANSATDTPKKSFSKEHFWYRGEVFNTISQKSLIRSIRFVKMKNCILHAHNQWEHFYANYSIPENKFIAKCYGNKKWSDKIYVECDTAGKCNI